MHNDLLNDRALPVYPVSFDFAPLTLTYSLKCVIQCVREFRIPSVETVSEVSQKSNVKIVT